MIIPAAQPERRLLQLFLQKYTAQRMVGAEIRWQNRHQQPAVDVLLVPGVVAHAVGAKTAGLRCRRNHQTTGADAERKCPAPGVGMAGELIGRHGQTGIFHAVLGNGHIPLLLLNAHPHGELLLLHGNPGSIEHPEGIPGAVADGKHQMLRRKGVFPLRSLHHSAAHPSVFRQNSRKPMPESNLSSQFFQLLPDVFHHDFEIIRAHMGICVPKNLAGCAECHEFPENLLHSGVVHPGMELTVGKRPRAALAELDVRFGVQRSALPEARNLRGPGVYILSPLQHDGPCTGPGQHQGAEQPRRSRPHNHRALGQAQMLHREMVFAGRIEADLLAAALFEHLVLVGHVHPQGVDQSHVVLFPGVHRAAEHLEALYLAAQLPGQLFGELRLRLAGTKAQSLNFKHR